MMNIVYTDDHCYIERIDQDGFAYWFLYRPGDDGGDGLAMSPINHTKDQRRIRWIERNLRALATAHLHTLGVMGL